MAAGRWGMVHSKTICIFEVGRLKPRALGYVGEQELRGRRGVHTSK